MEITQTLLDRFERKYIPEPNSGCWLWLACDNGNGYPVFDMRRPPFRYGHRFSYLAFKGPIPEGCEIDHLCMVRCCVNPDHLEAVSHRTNILRSPNTFGGKFARQTHCLRGHEFTDENTRHYRNGRWCRECLRLWDIANPGRRKKYRKGKLK